MANTPEIGFQFGVEGDQALLSTINRLREEMGTLKTQQDSLGSSAINLAGAWRGLISAAAGFQLIQIARDAAAFGTQLSNLTLTTKISIPTLAGLHDVMDEMGGDFDQASVGLVRMLKAQQDARDGLLTAKRAFQDIGISMKEVNTLSPEQMLWRVAQGFQGTASAAAKSQAAISLFGRGGYQLVAMFEKLGPQVQKHIEEMGKASGMTDEAVAADAKWTQTIAQLSVSMRNLAQTGITPLIVALPYLAAGFELIMAPIKSAIYAIDAIGFSTIETFLGIGKVIEDALGGHFARMVEDAKVTSLQMAAIYKSSGEDIGRAWTKDVSNAFAVASKPAPAAIGSPGDKPPGDKPTGDKPTKEKFENDKSNALKQQVQDELALDHILAQGREEAEKDSYDRGLLSLTEYFNRRRDEIRAAAAEEEKSLRIERSGIEQQVATVQAKPLTAKYDAATKQHDVAQLDQNLAHVDAQMAEDAAKADNDLGKNESDRFKATQEHLRKELEMQKQLADIEGNRRKADEADAKLHEIELTTELQQIGYTKAQIDAVLAESRAAESAKTVGAQAQQTFEVGASGKGGVKGLENTKADLGEQVASGEMLPYQASQKLTAEYRREIPLLEAQVKILRDQAAAIEAAAKARGETGPNAKADDLTGKADADQKTVDTLKAEIPKMDAGWMEWKNEAKSDIDQISTHLTTGLNGWITGHQRFGQAMAQMWNSIVMTALTSLEKMGAQFIAQHLKMLLFKQATNQAGVASDTAAAVQGDSIRRASGLKSVLMAAKVAAVHAFKSVWETVPFPINVVLAPVAAAGAFAGALALGAFASGGAVNTSSATPRFVGLASGGSIVARSMLGGGPISGPGTGTSDSIPILASNGEHVMTARASRAVGPGVLDAINANPERAARMLSGGFAQGGRISMMGAFLPPIRQPAPYSSEGFHRYASGGEISGPGGAGGGDVHFNLPTHIGEMNALDGASVRAMLQEHGDLVGSIAVAAVKRHFRTNGVGG